MIYGSKRAPRMRHYLCKLSTTVMKNNYGTLGWIMPSCSGLRLWFCGAAAVRVTIAEAEPAHRGQLLQSVQNTEATRRFHAVSPEYRGNETVPCNAVSPVRGTETIPCSQSSTGQRDGSMQSVQNTGTPKRLQQRAGCEEHSGWVCPIFCLLWW